MSLVDRVRKLLASPTGEWEAIRCEPLTIATLYPRYVMVLAAVPAVAGFVGFSVVGYGGLGDTYRVPVAAGLAAMVLSYVLTLGGVYALALLIDALAPGFGGQSDPAQAFKVAAFFPTAWWVAGVCYALPALSILAIVGGLYSLWLLHTGLAALMAVPEDRTAGYTAVVAVAAVVITIAIAVAGALAMPPGMRGF